MFVQIYLQEHAASYGVKTCIGRIPTNMSPLRGSGFVGNFTVPVTTAEKKSGRFCVLYTPHTVVANSSESSGTGWSQTRATERRFPPLRSIDTLNLPLRKGIVLEKS